MSTLYTSLVELWNLAKKVDNIDLQRMLVDIMEQSLTQQKRIEELTSEVRELTSKLKTRGQLVRELDCYWLADQNGTRTGAPFCSRCYDVDAQLVHLLFQSSAHDFCPQCNLVYLLGNQPHRSDQIDAFKRHEAALSAAMKPAW